jgi:NADH-quinone oxidoreductase subunit M
MIVALLAVPLAGSLLLLLPPERYRVRDAARFVRAAGILASGLALLIALLMAVSADYGRAAGMQHVIDLSWAPAIGLRFHVGVDGISLPLVVLTALLTFLCLLYSARVAPGGRALVGLLLLLEVGMLGTFVALDLLLFFVFFEVVLIPMYFVIANWGGPGRRAAAYKFILYTLLGSGVLLVGLLIIAIDGGTLDMVVLAQRHGAGLSHGAQIAAFLFVGLGLAVKAPMWPLHTWLPDAHTEAPTVGSVLLAGVLLKMGTYGFVRIALPMAPEGAEFWAPWLGLLAVIGIIYGSLACLAQRELKRMIAFSSVGHMGFVLLGIATLTPVGVNAALFGNIAHGLITGLLFFLAGAIKERYGTGELAAIGGGMLTRMPRLGSILTFACVASLGLPGLAGFWGEMLALLGAYRPAAGLPRETFVTFMVVGGLGAVLTMAYFLRLLYRITHGPPPSATGPAAAGPAAPETAVPGTAAPGTAASEPAITGPAAAEPAVPGTAAAETVVSGLAVSATAGRDLPDVRSYEYAAWVPLIVLTLIIGLWPKTLLALTDGPVRALLGGG